MTSEVLSPPRVSLRALLPGPVSRIGFGLLLVALVVRMTGDVSWDVPELTAAGAAHLLLLPLVALTLWAAAPSSGGAGRPLPVVLTLVALGVGYLGDYHVTNRLFPRLWDVLLRDTDWDGLVYQALITGGVLLLALAVQILAFRGWLGAGRPRLVADVGCWVIGAVAVAAVVAGVTRLDLGDYTAALAVGVVAWVAAVVLLTVVAWRADRLAGIGALLYIVSAVLLVVLVILLGGDDFVARAGTATYVVGQSFLAAGVLRKLHRTTAG